MLKTYLISCASYSVAPKGLSPAMPAMTGIIAGPRAEHKIGHSCKEQETRVDFNYSLKPRRCCIERPKSSRMASDFR